MGCTISRHQGHQAEDTLNAHDACEASRSRTLEIGDEMHGSESIPPPYTSVVDPRYGKSIASEVADREFKRDVTAGQPRQ